jgi:phosphate transport system substrate-binding protein
MVGFLFLVLLLLMSLLVACGEPVATPESVFIQVAGSTSMVQLASDLAVAFVEQTPTVSIDVVGQGTCFGLNELVAGRADIALAAWLPDDLDEQWRAAAVARDGVAIIVHRSNSVEGVGLLQLQDLFSGRIHEWTGVGDAKFRGEVQVVSREEGSGMRDAFETLVMGEKGVTSLAVVAPSSEAVLEYIANHEAAVGYVSMGVVTPAVKVLSVEGELPTVQTVREGSYPLSHELWFVAAQSPETTVRYFLRFAQGPAGQQIVGRYFGRIQ